MTIRAFSYGGGVQSTAALVLAAQREIDFPLFLFSNVGDDSERADTLVYVRDVAMPFAEEHGIELRELRHRRRDGDDETLYKQLTRPGSRSTGIPIYLEGSGAPARRSCTADFKIRRIGKELRRRGASADDPATVGLGISLDEYWRAHRGEDPLFERRAYPLLDLRLTRQDCINIIARAGLPVPPKSSCWFCPFHRLPTWQAMLRNEPELFDRAVALEKILSDRSESLGRGKVFLHRKLRPLDQVVGEQADMFESDDVCESGFCMT